MFYHFNAVNYSNSWPHLWVRVFLFCFQILVFIAVSLANGLFCYMKNLFAKGLRALEFILSKTHKMLHYL